MCFDIEEDFFSAVVDFSGDASEVFIESGAEACACCDEPGFVRGDEGGLHVSGDVFDFFWCEEGVLGHFVLRFG